MNKPQGITLAAIITLLSFASCNKEKQENNCLSFTTAQVTKVAKPNTIQVNQEVDLSVSYYLSNGCGKFEGLEATSNGSTIIISLKAKYEGCICTEILLNGKTNYKFKAKQSGVYYLKFLQPNNTYLIDTITVN